ncbi:hypothetical protein HFP51_09020 [Parasphingopyxis sp. CP4]|uniref:hypothetical protein n=1 Tax=Parasphingopyxis sp. CP4 TaxID=2724527 RepID=UPI0015A11756|nr:hypothetical protein [Parasphingopyxis sp. CP4]QLC22306.1 hypothetical protein HFP51_09020 [Parasphingopyxis sp. CP4]
MVIRVVSLLAVAALAAPASAESLPYDIGNFYRTPAYTPEIGYDISSLLYDRTPDHAALGYRTEAITGGSATHRVVREYGPLDYDTDGLLAVIFAKAEIDETRDAAD